MKNIIILLLFLGLISASAEENLNKKLTILFTHDLHSYMLPHKKTVNGELKTAGGYAKIGYFIKEYKKQNKDSTLVLDAGDMIEGTLFHTLNQTESAELRTMGKMGYDVVTLGNHDFDFYPEGLALSLKTAKEKSNHLPEIVFSNALFTKDNPKDKNLKEEFKKIPVKEYTVIEKNGLKIGIFGILGKDAASDTPFAKPVKFGDPVKSAKRIVSILKNKENVDMIICLSHSGTSRNIKHSEDEILAKKVTELDVIVSAHSHTVLKKPVIYGKTIIVSAGSYGENIGILEISFSKKDRAKISSYTLKSIDETINDDKEILTDIENFKEKINSEYLSKFNTTYDKVIAKINYNMETLEYIYTHPGDTGLGNLITDSYRFAVSKNFGGQ